MKQTDERDDIVCEYIERNPDCTTNDIHIEFGLSRDAIKHTIKKLLAANRIHVCGYVKATERRKSYMLRLLRAGPAPDNIVVKEDATDDFLRRRMLSNAASFGVFGVVICQILYGRG